MSHEESESGQSENSPELSTSLVAGATCLKPNVKLHIHISKQVTHIHSLR